MKKKDKICGICKLVIDEGREFAEFIHYSNSKKILSKVYYHIQCFREKLSGGKNIQMLQSKINNLLERANLLLPGGSE